MELCLKILPTRANTKYDPDGLHKCHLEKGHQGTRCKEMPFIDGLRAKAKKVAEKISRDATKTTGASWKSEDAGPNRISRWTMLLSDAELKKLGINIDKLSPIVVAKLRDKAAGYDDCIQAAMKLTWLAYGMKDAPLLDATTKAYLESFFGPIIANSTGCLICKSPINFNQFHSARRGKAEIETAHAQPRSHNADNVGFAHRDCNIAQGDKSLDDFYDWMYGILQRAGRI